MKPVFRAIKSSSPVVATSAFGQRPGRIWQRARVRPGGSLATIFRSPRKQSASSTIGFSRTARSCRQLLSSQVSLPLVKRCGSRR